MREEFTNASGHHLYFTDEGIEFKGVKYHRLYPFGSMRILKWTLGQVQIVGYEDSLQFLFLVSNKQDRKRAKFLTQEAIKKNNMAPKCTLFNLDEDGNKLDSNTIKPEKRVKLKDREFKKRCNVCGTIFCYKWDDIKKNISSGFNTAISGVGAATNAVGGSAYNSFELNKMADRNKARATDLNHCPNCNSTDLKDLSDEEFERIKQEQNAAANNSVSAADELKKFKELLDMGAITQEEFDAKKKQLLGL